MPEESCRATPSLDLSLTPEDLNVIRGSQRWRPSIILPSLTERRARSSKMDIADISFSDQLLDMLHDLCICEVDRLWNELVGVDLNRWKGVDPLFSDSPCEHCLSSKDLYEELSALRQFKRSPEGTSSSFPHPIIRCVICCPRPIRGLLTFSPSVVAHHIGWAEPQTMHACLNLHLSPIEHPIEEL